MGVYDQFFQVPFLISTEKYYRNESASYVENNSVADYLRKAEGRLDEEMKRVDMYLHDSTRKDVSYRSLFALYIQGQVADRS